MKQIRRAIFETNSSSLHTLVVPKTISTDNKKIYFYFDSFGWESWEGECGASYFYTAIYELYSEDEAERIMNNVIDVMNRYGFECEVSSSKYDDIYSTIDHAYELKPFIERLLSNEDELVAFITGGYVYTGNDNEEESFPPNSFEDTENIAYVYYKGN